MAIRVTQQTMYNKMVGGMQSNLGAYMESIEQGSSQKKVNRPSDDPAGTYRILTTRVDMTNTAQYQENVDTAKGWLNLADDILSRQVTTAITGLKALAEQASTGTYTAEQRQHMADQARQYFGQILNLANTEFEGKQLFAGHKYDHSAFQMGLAPTSWDENWNSAIKNGNVGIMGPTEHPIDNTVIIQFGGEGIEPTPEGEEGKPLTADSVYRWSKDGGKTWVEGQNPVAKTDPDGTEYYEIEANGAIMTIRPTRDENGKAVYPNVKNCDPSIGGAGAENGTLIYLRPGAYYQGDDKDPPADITIMGSDKVKDLNSDPDNPQITATGTFNRNVLIRFNSAPDANGKFSWSYSTDRGTNWTNPPLEGQVGADGKLRLPIPGGYIDMPNAAVEEGTQIMVHPSRSDLGYEIMKDTYLTVNGVGKDIFGGWYEGKPSMENDEENLFEVVGSFIGYLEGNNQEGCQKTLVALTKAEKTILAEASRIGGMENRIEMAADVLSFQKIDQQERLSYVEDIDLTELLTKLTRQQIAYQTVLQSSSMIMNMSLANYI